MSYATGYAEIVPPMVGPYTARWSPVCDERTISATPASGAYELGNLAAYVPILVLTTCVARRLWWANGGTVSASYNVDCGIYADAGGLPGTRVVSSGSTAQGTASEVQFVDITDTALSPGRYWIALAVSTTSATVLRAGGSQGFMDAAYRFEETSAFPLPASATPVESSTTSYIYLCGFATTASP